MQSNAQGCGCLILFCIVGAVFLTWLGPPKRPANPLADTSHLRWEACYAAQREMKAALKAPATADFPSCYEASTEAHVDLDKAGPGAYQVYTYVDAQNSFGAKLRGHYACAARTFDGEQFHVLCLPTDRE